jgi:hypothetical protein
MTTPMPPDFIAQKLAILRDIRKGNRIETIEELTAFKDGILSQGYAIDGELLREIEAKRKILTQGR